MQAEYETGIARLAEDMAKRDEATASRLAELKIDMARRDTEAARRDKDNLRWLIGLWVAAIVVIGVLIRWPGPAAAGPWSRGSNGPWSHVQAIGSLTLLSPGTL